MSERWTRRSFRSMSNPKEVVCCRSHRGACEAAYLRHELFPQSMLLASFDKAAFGGWRVLEGVGDVRGETVNHAIEDTRPRRRKGRRGDDGASAGTVAAH